MATAEVRLDLALAADAAADEVEEATARLRRELLELEIERVERVSEGEAPAGTRAFEILALGSLIVTLGRNIDALAQVVRTVKEWVGRDAKRTVVLELDGDRLEVAGVSSEEQERLISAWLARHSTFLKPEHGVAPKRSDRRERRIRGSEAATAEGTQP